MAKQLVLNDDIVQPHEQKLSEFMESLVSEVTKKKLATDRQKYYTEQIIDIMSIHKMEYFTHNNLTVRLESTTKIRLLDSEQ